MNLYAYNTTSCQLPYRQQNLHTWYCAGIVHLDIRPANIFITSDSFLRDYRQSSSVDKSFQLEGVSTINSKKLEIVQRILSGEYLLKLGDFGHCSLIEDGSRDIIIEGEIKYCAKELICGSSPFDLTKADVFSLGASLYELCLGKSLASSGEHASEDWHALR